MAMTEQEKAERARVFAKAKAYLGDAYNSRVVGMQVTRYMGQGISADTICSTLDYFYGVRGNDPAQSRGGIGIVPYVLQEASDYYARIAALEQDAERRAANVDANAAITAKAKVVRVRREPITRPRSWNSFDLN